MRPLAFGLTALAAFCGCAMSHEAPPPCDYEAPDYLHHSDVPSPTGRIGACEACDLAASAYEARCGVDFDRGRCTPTGACDYAELRHWIDAMDCPEIADDPCIRPDAAYYWRSERD